MRLVKIFSHSAACLFMLVIVPFAIEKLGHFLYCPCQFLVFSKLFKPFLSFLSPIPVVFLLGALGGAVSTMHVELVFVQSERCRSSFTLLHEETPFS